MDRCAIGFSFPAATQSLPHPYNPYQNRRHSCDHQRRTTHCGELALIIAASRCQARRCAALRFARFCARRCAALTGYVAQVSPHIHTPNTPTTVIAIIVHQKTGHPQGLRPGDQPGPGGLARARLLGGGEQQLKGLGFGGIWRDVGGWRRRRVHSTTSLNNPASLFSPPPLSLETQAGVDVIPLGVYVIRGDNMCVFVLRLFDAM